MLDDWVDKLIGAVVIAFVLSISYALYCIATSEKITLIKDEWVCTKSHTSTIYIQSGSVLVPMESKICDQYERK